MVVVVEGLVMIMRWREMGIDGWMGVLMDGVRVDEKGMFRTTYVKGNIFLSCLFVSLSLCLFVSLSLCLFVSLSFCLLVGTKKSNNGAVEGECDAGKVNNCCNRNNNQVDD